MSYMSGASFEQFLFQGWRTPAMHYQPITSFEPFAIVAPVLFERKQKKAPQPLSAVGTPICPVPENQSGKCAVAG